MTNNIAMIKTIGSAYTDGMQRAEGSLSSSGIYSAGGGRTGVFGGASGGSQFAKVLSDATRLDKAAALKVSKHAESRLRDRNIRLSDAQREKIVNALEKADRKGVKDALVLLDGFALVANAKSLTVITAAGEGDLRQNIFTNIDGAVFA